MIAHINYPQMSESTSMIKFSTKHAILKVSRQVKGNIVLNQWLTWEKTNATFVHVLYTIMYIMFLSFYLN
jgi:hypothetical protein